MFANEIKRLRKELGISQAEMAEKIGTTQAHVSMMEAGKSNANGLAVDVFMRLCEALKVNCDHFRPFLADEPPTPAKPKKKRKA